MKRRKINGTSPQKQIDTINFKGVIIKRSDFGEAHSMFTLLENSLGKIEVVSFGSRNEKSTRRSSLLVSNYVCGIISKPRDHNPYSLLEINTLKSYPDILTQLNKAAYLFVLFEIIDILTIKENPFHYLDYILNTLDKIGAGIEIEKYVFFTLLKLFQAEGVLSRAENEMRLAYAVKELAGDQYNPGNGSLRFIQDVFQCDNCGSFDGKHLSKAVIEDLIRFFKQSSKYHFGKDLKSLSLIRSSTQAGEE